MNLYDLTFIFKPTYWIMNDPYDKHVDEIVSLLLDKYEFTNVGEHWANLGDASIWIGNIPYNCMRVSDPELYNYRPSRATIERGVKRIRKAKQREREQKIKNLKKKYLNE